MDRELEEQTALADAGETAAVFLHDLGNVLNNLLLESKLLLREIDESHQARLHESCQLITQAAEQMSRLADYRQSCRRKGYPVCLNTMLREIISSLPSVHEKIDLQCEEPLPPITTTISDIKRLLRFLLSNLCNLDAKEADRIQLNTSAVKDRVELMITFSGVPLTEEELPVLFQPFQLKLPEWIGLEFAACQNLVRRMQGCIHLQLIKPGRCQITIDWPIRP